MNTIATSNWPHDGFEPLFKYIASFVHLNINLGSHAACRRYHDEWMGRYVKAMREWTDYDVAIWCVRIRQALKLSFSATYFALCSRKARSENVLASEHYLAYYAMMHAMWAVLYLHPDETIVSLSDITHSKIANVFHSSFSASKNSILKYDTKQIAEDLRFLREYYSYRMPLNPPFGDGEFSSAQAPLGGFIKQSIQLANLHSHIIDKAAEKFGKSSSRVPADRHSDFRKDFFIISGKEHKSRSLSVLDPADTHALADFLNKGCDIMPLSLGYEHMFDNYMTYGYDRRPGDEILQETRSRVYAAFYRMR